MSQSQPQGPIPFTHIRTRLWAHSIILLIAFRRQASLHPHHHPHPFPYSCSLGKPPPISQRAPQQAAENGARSFEYEALLLSLMQKNAGPKNPPGGPLPYRAPLNPYPVNWVERRKKKSGTKPTERNAYIRQSF